jgi:hypothetical protein
MRSAVLCGLLLAVLAVAGPATAAIIPLQATLDGAQANAGAGTGSLGTGVGTITFDTGTNLLSWNISWSGLTGPATLAHFHGPALPHQNAGVQVGISTISPSIGNANISAAQATDLLNDLWYINIHTASFPAGEIRGQVTVVPEPASLLLAAGGLGVLAALRRRRRG